MPAPVGDWADHPRRCHARSGRTHRRCGRWALVTSNYCQYHGGRRSHLPTLRKMPGFYSKYMGPKLAQRVREILSRPSSEQVSLYQELALARTNVAETLKLYEVLLDPEQSAKLTVDTRVAIMSAMREAMDQVREMVTACAKIEKDAQDKVSMPVVNLVVQQIIIAVNEVCGTENLAIAEALAKKIEDIRLPVQDRFAPTVCVDLVGPVSQATPVAAQAEAS